MIGLCYMLNATYHLSTNLALSSGFCSFAGAQSIDGNSAHEAGNSTADFEASTNGGAVILDKSPFELDSD